jgi:hypothetical protein
VTRYKILDKTTGEERVPDEFSSMTEAMLFALGNNIEGCNVSPVTVKELMKVDDK